MIISQIQDLHLAELDDLLGDQDERLAAVLCNGAEVAVISVEVDNGGAPVRNYYNVIFANGVELVGLHGAHLRGIENWK